MEVLDGNEFILEPIYYKLGHNQDSEIKLRQTVLVKLREAQNYLSSKYGYKLKIWDGFRTIETQKKLYEDFFETFKEQHADLNDEEIRKEIEPYIAFPSLDPASPPPHNTGGVVDLTIVDQTGQELNMGTEFDDFSERANTNYFITKGKDEASADIFHKNRMILKEVMEHAGIIGYNDEWWHFNYGDQEWARNSGNDFAIYSSAEK